MTNQTPENLIAEARELVFRQDFHSQNTDMISRLADALEARLPSENDREALKRIAEVASEQRLKESIGEWREALGAANDSFPDDWELEFWHAGYKHGALAMIEHQLSRAAVPDAATAAIERVTAERDSAMARIAKAWELHEPFTWSFGYGPVQSCKWCADHGVSQEVASWPCPTIQALDGAPEPEWEYSVGFNDPEDGWINDSADIHDNYEDARSDYSEPNWLVEDRVVRRRKAGPWLPVESEGEVTDD